MGKRIIHTQDKINLFNVRLMEDQEYVKSRADQEDRKMLSDRGAWMSEGVVEAQQTRYEALKTTIEQYTSGQDSRLKELKRELASVVSGPVVLTDHFERGVGEFGR